MAGPVEMTGPIERRNTTVQLRYSNLCTGSMVRLKSYPYEINADNRWLKLQRCVYQRLAVNQNGFRLDQNGFSQVDRRTPMRGQAATSRCSEWSGDPNPLLR